MTKSINLFFRNSTFPNRESRHHPFRPRTHSTTSMLMQKRPFPAQVEVLLHEQRHHHPDKTRKRQLEHHRLCHRVVKHQHQKLLPMHPKYPNERVHHHYRHDPILKCKIKQTIIIHETQPHKKSIELIYQIYCRKRNGENENNINWLTKPYVLKRKTVQFIAFKLQADS